MGLREVVEWDVTTWSRAIRHWESAFDQGDGEPLSGLELGARHGGVSCFFADRFGCRMTCTDVDLSRSTAKELHVRHGVAELMTYEEANAKKLNYEDESFDFVVFKSMLGAVGAKGQQHRMGEAVSEIARVLKPGGKLFVAENLQGTGLHRLARRWFVPWGKSWAYMTLRELSDLLKGSFSDQELHSTGITAAFVPKPEVVRSGFAALDNSLLRWAPASWKYVAYGHAIK